MAWYNRNLPSMSALAAFEAVARHHSITRAGIELGRTPSAISHQLRFLENELKTPLILRNGKNLELTVFGARYAVEVRKALAVINNAINVADDAGLQGRLTISCTTGFGVYWLCRNLQHFRALFPHIRLSVRIPSSLADASDADVDVFILHGNGHWPDHWSELLAETNYMPVCSPAFLNSCGGTITLDDLATLPLIHLNGTSDWIYWCSNRGVPLPVAETGIFFENVALALTATVSGLGIAMATDLVYQSSLTEGKIVRILDHTVRSPTSYYIVTDYAKVEQQPVKLFLDWLRAEFSKSGV